MVAMRACLPENCQGQRYFNLFLLARARVARVFELEVLRTALRRRFEVRLARPELARVDLRDGFPVRESSRAAPPLFATRLAAFRDAVEPPPALRSVALLPGSAVSTGTSRRLRAGRLGFGGWASRI